MLPLPPLNALLDLCWQAHEVILPYWRSQKDLGVAAKDDDSPVTLADKASHHVIMRELSALSPDIPIISEEGDHPTLAADSPFWLVDPLDGTKGFIRGSDEFTVNIALIEKNYPVWGLLGVPAKGVIYYGGTTIGAHKISQHADAEPIHCAKNPRGASQRILASRSHATPKLDQWLEEQSIITQTRIGANSALKFALIAEGSADCYPRFGPTMEWDSASGQAIIEAAGGEVLDLEGKRFGYGKKDYLNGGFVCWGG